ncbi:nidogen-like [Watersipora subatra]|uniref:nidogen-like n=1 Tax=Watersipora subatra TaxID=2589382 RepID=UPI00355C5BB8
MIASDGSRSFCAFLYLNDGINWIQADVKEGIPEVAAQAGFDSGPQLYDALVQPGSSFPTALNWDRTSNCETPGVWMYKIGYLREIEQPDLGRIGTGQPDPEISEKGQCEERCSLNSTCVEGCCVCNNGYYGNGISCLKADVLRMNGRIVGRVNEQDIADVTMHVYASLIDGRAYTAISKLPPLVGYPSQLLVPLGELIGWLFAKGVSSNGFTISGGIINYSATIEVGAEILRVEVTMTGVIDGKVRDLLISVNGDLPANTIGYNIAFTDYTAQYTKVGRGTYRSEGTRNYIIRDKEFPFYMKETITFNECNTAPDFYRVHHSGYYVVYNENDLTTRFTLMSQTQLEDDNVCASNNCHYNAVCVPKGNSYTCTCKQGYEGSGRDCTDLDECATGANTCSPLAICRNTDGGYICTCTAGYSGDGYYCAIEEERKSCRDMTCHQNAYCEQRGDQVFCICNVGFRGDGTNCEPIVVTCNEADICDENADCVYNGETRSYECQCKDGFSGDGENCDIPIDASCAYCAFHAECVYDIERLFYKCVCKAGFTGDGRSCQLIDFREAQSTTPTPQTTLSREQQNNCYYNRDLCGENSYCVQNNQEYRCVCNPGYLYSASVCVEAACQSHSECGDNAHCQLSIRDNKFQCKCNDGFQGDGRLCTTTAVNTCNEVNICHPDADCYDTASGPRCVCRSGFIGDGTICTPLQDNCMTRPALCDRNAVCSRASAGDYVCICNPGYEGDGTSCKAMNEQGNYLLFTQGMSVFRVPFYQAGGDRGRRILHKSGQTLVGLAADCKDRMFYYSDIGTGTISRASLDNSSDSQVIIDGLSSPEGLAVDWVSRVIFFTDSALDRIEVADLEGRYRKVIVDTGLVNPRAIAVDPIDGKIYWTDWNRAEAKIEVANMDGTGRRVLVDTDLSLPNGITYNMYRQQVCWADAGTQKLECINRDGRGRMVVYDLATYPFSLTTYRDNFYWTDWNKNAIQSIPRGGDVLGASILFPNGGNGKAYSIEPVPSQCFPGANRCSYNNGECKFLCLPTSDREATCACPDNVDQDECNRIFRS